MRSLFEKAKKPEVSFGFFLNINYVRLILPQIMLKDEQVVFDFFRTKQ
jgi:hypothetical protein